MNGEEIAELLRGHGIAVRRVIRLPRAAGTVPAWAVHLDSARPQRVLARACLRAVPGVSSVAFSGLSPWVVFVTLASRT